MAKGITIDVSMNMGKFQQKLRAIAKHTEALANELDAIDNAIYCECGSGDCATFFSDNLITDYQCNSCGKHFSRLNKDELPTRLEGSD